MELSRRFQLPSGELYCRSELLQQLAEQAESGYRRTPWGGPEIGGILIGQRSGNRVTITGIQAFEIEHEFGPSYHLCDKDHDSLQQLIDAVAVTRVSEVVGWYHTTSRESGLDAEARATDQQFFSKPWQLAFVIQRGRNVKAHFGIFCKAQGDMSHAVIDFGLADLSRFPEVEEPAAEAPKLERITHTVPVVAADVQEEDEIFDDKTLEDKILEDKILEDELPFATAGFEAKSASSSVTAKAPATVSATAAETRQNPLLAFFGFRYDPFYDGPEPAMYCDCPSHRDVLAGLGYGVWSRKGVLLLTGEKGFGKTMILRCLAQDLKKDAAQFSLLSPAPQGVAGLRQAIARDLELSVPSTGKASLPIALWARGTQCLEQGKNLAILLDDAHLLDAAALAEIEALTTFGTRKEKTLQLVLTGEPSIEDRLNEPAFRAFAQQVAVRAALHPLDATETASYIDTRLARAGVTPGVVFPPDAVEAVFERTGGVPSQINTLCAAAIRAAYDQRVQRVTSAFVAQAYSSDTDAAENQAAPAVG
ncbi:MAG: AAA family ATPase [Bryobacteraceae bacterium]